MRLVRWGEPGAERPGVMVGESRRDVGHLLDDFTPAWWRGGGAARLAEVVAREGEALPRVPDDARWAACIPRPGKLLCIGLNYRDHAAETGATLPSEPVLFMKAPNTVVGPYDTLLIPRGSEKTDWEVELGVVIGRDARYLDSPADAAAHIAGWCCCHDVSERAFQLERGGQWTKGKSCDTFAPTGPWLATPDEVPDVRDLRLTLEVNGVRMQDGTTADMAFDPYHIVWYVSQFMTLEAGDLVSTGTPAGVGLGRDPQVYLRAGDDVTLAITRLGAQRQRVARA